MTLTFFQTLLLLEALDTLAATVREDVAAGELLLQDTLEEIEALQDLIASTDRIRTTCQVTPDNEEIAR